MADTAFETGKSSNGQTVECTFENKDVLFTGRTALFEYIKALLEMQENYCALTGLLMDYAEDGGHREMFCSLDRIDSDGHYAEVTA